MGARKPEYRHGRIIGAYLRTKKGKRELHPAVILTPDAEIIQPEGFDPRKGGENVVVVIGVSSKYMHYKEPYVQLPFHEPGHAVTKLTKDSAAIVGWYDIVHLEDDIEFKAGDVPAEIMKQINDAVLKNIQERVPKQLLTIAEVVAFLVGK